MATNRRRSPDNDHNIWSFSELVKMVNGNLAHEKDRLAYHLLNQHLTGPSMELTPNLHLSLDTCTVWVRYPGNDWRSTGRFLYVVED